MPYILNGQSVDIADAVVQNDTTFVPAADVAEALGGSVEWRHEQKKARLIVDGKAVWVEPDNAVVDVNGRDADLGAAPYLENDVLWVPLRVFREAFGMTISANDGVVTVDR